MLPLKIRKVGNSFGVILPKEALSRLKLSEGGTLYLTEAADGGYRLTPYDEEFRQQMEEAERIMARDRDVLRELAK